MLETREVPFFNYRAAFANREPEYLDVIRDVIRRGAFILQRDVSEFEDDLARYLKVKHAIGVGNATDALSLSFRAAGLKPGDEVIFPSHTMVAGPAAVATLGGIPVPVECGDDHLMDPRSIEPAITGRTRFIMPTQLNGRTCDMDAICAIAERRSLVIIEDSAQGLGSKYRGRHAGTFGLAGVFSFYPAKVLGCFGDGGAVVTDDDQLARTIRLLRDHGRNEDGDVELWGLNSRLDNVQAALLSMQFRDFDSTIRRRREIASIYENALQDLSELTLPPGPDTEPLHFDSFQNYEIEADRRDELKQFLKMRGVGTLIQWGGKAVHQFSKLGFKVSLPVTERVFRRCLMLPLNMTVTNDDAAYVAESIREFYR
jgi:dTDP-4-amino-4,6-dideoxygalactose transaminase